MDTSRPQNSFQDLSSEEHENPKDYDPYEVASELEEFHSPTMCQDKDIHVTPCTYSGSK